MRNKHIPASYLILTDNGKILLSKRCNTGFEDGKYSLISGKVEPGESYRDCIVREGKEEIGIDIDKNDLEFVHFLYRDNGYFSNQERNERSDVFFMLKKWQGVVENMEPDKCESLEWFDIDSIPENTAEYIKLVLEFVRKGVRYSEKVKS